MKTFEIATKKNKRKQLIKTITLTTLTTLTSLTLLHLGLAKLTSDNAWSIQRYREQLQAFSMPNISNRTAYFIPTSTYTGLVHIDQTKDIAGLEVPYQQLDIPYSIRPGLGYYQAESYMDKDGTASYTYTTGNKVPHFFNTAYDYSSPQPHAQVTQDLDLLPQMSGQAVEVAVTFSQPLTFEEIAERLPDTLKVNWYWIGTASAYDTTTLRETDLLGFKADLGLATTYEQEQDELKKTEKMSAAELEAYYRDKPVQTVSSPKDGFANSYTFFVGHLKDALDKGWLESSYGSDAGQLSVQEDATTYLKANPDGATAKFAGIILTGRAEDFAGLGNQDWIFGSNIGQSLQIQPYHHLRVE